MYAFVVSVHYQSPSYICGVFSSCVVNGSRLSQSVTGEEDNCCGCNVLAIRRHFLDRELKQVHIVYTSCHDAVSRMSIG